MSGDVRLLTFTSLYPSAVRPRHGIFVESRLVRLLARGGVTARVVAPVPWFPLSGARWGEYGRMAATPLREERLGIEVHHPRFPVIPRIGMVLQPAAMARSGLRAVEALLRTGADFDVIDSHYLYPDGVAAAAIASRTGRPYVLSARGTDVNVIAQMPGPRAAILEAIVGASGVIAVSSALQAALVGLGVAGDRITVLRNGVDAQLFRPEERESARRELGLAANGVPIIASVGNLIASKRHDLVIEAVARLQGAHAIVVGRGEQRARLEGLARKLQIVARVHFLGEIPQARLRFVYSAANVLVLASEREGWPNVLLESAACGTPVVAFDVGGVPEIMTDPTVGTIVREAHAAAPLAAAIRGLLERPPAGDAVRAAAEKFSWEPVLDAQLALYRRAAAAARAAPVAAVRATARA